MRRRPGADHAGHARRARRHDDRGARDAVDTHGLVGRTHREAPEIDGVVRIAGAEGRPGAIVTAEVTGAIGPDLDAAPVLASVAVP